MTPESKAHYQIDAKLPMADWAGEDKRGLPASLNELNSMLVA
jgi:hypothetical protein